MCLSMYNTVYCSILIILCIVVYTLDYVCVCICVLYDCDKYSVCVY